MFMAGRRRLARARDLLSGAVAPGLVDEGGVQREATARREGSAVE